MFKGCLARGITMVLLAVAGLLLIAADASAQGRKLDTIVASGTLRVGLINQPPFAQYQTGTRTWKGPSYDLAKLIADSMGVKLEIIESNYQNVVPALQAEKIDVIMSPLYATPKRAMVAWFTEPYRYERGGLLMKSTEVSKYKTVEDLNKPEVTIVASLGSASEGDARRLLPKATVKAVPADGLLLEVQSGRVTAWYADMTTVDLASKTNETWATVWNKDFEFNAYPMAFAIRKGDEDLLYFLNTTLNYFVTQGVVQEIDRQGGLITSRRTRSGG